MDTALAQTEKTKIHDESTTTCLLSANHASVGRAERRTLGPDEFFRMFKQRSRPEHILAAIRCAQLLGADCALHRPVVIVDTLVIAAAMKQRNDSRFGTIFEPASISEMIDAVVADEASFSHPHVRMWRGQGDERWLLDSGCYRMLRLSKPIPTERDAAYHERWLLNRATHRGYRFHEGRELSDFELLARLQHHGAATRLIDATRNILVGLFFACYTEPSQTGLLFGISSNHLGGGEGLLLSGSYEDVIKVACKYGHPQTWDPPAVSKRIAAQHSQFIYSGIKPNQLYGTLALESNAYLMIFRIEAEQKLRYLYQLKSCFDISPETMFPDLDGFAAQHSHTQSQFSTARW